MAEPLKYMYNPAFFEKLCPAMRETIPGFDCRDFIFRIFNNTWPDLELKQRVRHISRVLHHFMPKDFASASRIITALARRLQAELPEQTFATIFLADYIEIYGIEDFSSSFDAMEEVTKLVSAEFAVRPFIVRYPEKSLEKMLAWSKNEHPHVRRLASEGCRPRLPWGAGIPFLKANPKPVIQILENLKADESLFVRKSVANNINDIAKDHPQLVLSIAREWKDSNPHTQWIIKHGSRSLLKKGNTDVLHFHGFDAKRKSQIKSLNLSVKKVKIGNALEFEFIFLNKENATQKFRLEYAIDYLTSTQKRSKKIFQITEKEFEPETPTAFRRKQSFKNLTTRKHYKGTHSISILVNGRIKATANFMVC